MLVFSPLAGLLMEASEKQNARRSDSVFVRMPQCEGCGAQGRPVLRHVDSEEYLMTFIVHRLFQEKVEQPNPDPPLKERQ